MDAIYSNALKITASIKDLLNLLSSAIDTQKFMEQLQIIEKTKTNSEDSIKMYSNVFTMIEQLSKLLNSLEMIKLDCDLHSETFRMSYKKLFNKIKARYLAFHKETEINKILISTEIATHLFTEISSATDKLKLLEDLRNKYYKSKDLIHIYAKVLQMSIDGFFSLDKQLVYQLIAWIEEDKKNALAGYYQTDSKANKSNNPPQTRFGLLPSTNSMSLKELLPIIMTEEKAIINTINLDQLSKKLKIGFIVLNSIVYTPVEYDVKPLINYDEAVKFIQPQEYGINIKTVERFKTLSSFGNINKWEFSIDFHNRDADRFYILETLDGKTFRALTPWISANRFSVAKFRVQRILDYTQKTPSKALEYHARCITLATKNMFLGRSLELENFENQLTDVESGQMQSNITEFIINAVDKFIIKEYKNKFKSPMDISDILHDPNIGRSFIEAVTKEFAKDKSRFDAGKFPISEIIASFSTALQTASRRFVREVHNNYLRNPLKVDEMDKAVEKIHQVLQNSVELVVKLDDNLFTSNYYKYLILNYT